MYQDETPLVVLYGFPEGEDKVVFLGRQDEIVLGLNAEIRSTFLRFLSLCNGFRRVGEIRKLLPDVTEDLFDVLLSVGKEQGVIRDSRELFLGFHEDSANPPRFAYLLTSQQVRELVENRPLSLSGIDSIKTFRSDNSVLAEVLANRKSSDVFGEGQIPLGILGGLLEAMYSNGMHRSVPSAGGLYPLSLYIAKRVQQSALRSLYYYDPESSELRNLGIMIEDDRLSHALDSYQGRNCDLVVFIAADLERITAKYANRGYRYALIETGHAAQNAYLFCAENHLGIREYCGFQDKPLAELLGLRYPGQAVLSALLVGEMSDAVLIGTSDSAKATSLREALVGENNALEWTTIRSLHYENYQLQKSVAVAKFRSSDGKGGLKSDKDNVAFGVAVTSDQASIKAMAEGFERYASGIVRVDARACACDLDADFFDPRIATPFSPQQIEYLGLQAFDPDVIREWVRGYRWSTGAPVYVPIDHAFYPLGQSVLNPLCYRASSSGVAAHFDVDEAVSRALYELVERDALALAWYSQRRVHALPDDSINDSLKTKTELWEGKGWKLKLLDLSVDSIPVVLATFVSDSKYPYFVTGASAHPSLEVAMGKAVDEAEIMLLLVLGGPEKPPGSPEDARSPVDHGVLYFNQENLWRVKWLLEDHPGIEANDLTGSDPFKKFDPVILDLTPEKSEVGLRVIRTLSESLIPINFGYWTEHAGHSRFSVLECPWRQDHPSFPHFFA